MKIISLCPSNTEICTYLGIENTLIAIDDYSDYPPHIQHLPKVGPDLSIRMDEVEALEPDLVLASLSVPGMEKNVEELVARGIPHLVLNPQSLQDIADDILTVGKAIGDEDLAIKKANEYLQTVEKYAKISKQIEHKPTLYWEWWPNPIFTPGKVNWLTEISELAGGRNIFEDVELASVQTTPEDVLNLNPDYICLAWVGVPLKRIQPKKVKERPGWSEMKAIKDDNIFVLEEPLYCRPSPRLLEGLKKLAGILHPKEYKAIL
ncbi:cobalamin-binding protein [Peribacillus alkalitolerans]|uniref:cobalamin-binding protein n=1 Tax=Peribacillus alkalitolerans TaxID=1550385 RepID=UPI0013D7E080|nr:cobalamin-binding protein [Peribacillus alkalitolerans]